MKHLLPCLSLLLLLGLQVPLNATPPSVTFERPFNGQTHVISESGGIRFRAVASATDAEPISLVSVLVTNLGNSTLVANYSVTGTASALALDNAFTSATIGRYQFTAVAFATDGENSRTSTSITVTNVGRGEKRFNEFIYKASHNSYQRGEPLWQQVDYYNCWMVELDCFWDDNYQGGSSNINVTHYCDDTHSDRTLSQEFTELTGSSLADDRVTVIYLQFNTGGSLCGYDDWPDKPFYRDFIKRAITNYLNAAWVYPYTEFANRDNYSWPSMQELKRRGYHYVIILNTRVIARTYDEIFFGETNPDGSPLDNDALTNHDGGCDIDTFENLPTYPDSPRWMSRVYPGSACSEECDYHNGNYYDTALSRDYTFLASNCVDDDHTFNLSTHAPEPVFVMESSSEDKYRGTLLHPYTDINFAILRASSMSTIQIGSKTTPYDLLPGINVITKPMVLKRLGSGGTVVIQKP
jgi:hypothetical protein